MVPVDIAHVETGAATLNGVVDNLLDTHISGFAGALGVITVNDVSDKIEDTHISAADT
jgi:hypothetical protein